MMDPAAILLRPVLPIWLVVCIVIAVGVAAWRTYRGCSLTAGQRWSLWGMRVAALLVLAWLLMQAWRRQYTVERENPAFLIALDASASMEDNPGGARLTRAERARDYIESRRVEGLAKNYRVFRHLIGADVEEITGPLKDVRFNAPRSHIGSGLNRMVDRLRGDNIAGILLLSDGLDQSGERLAPDTLNSPVFVVELEDTFEVQAAAEADAWIADVSHPPMMVVNWKAGVDVLVRRRGTGAVQIPIRFSQGGQVLRTSMLAFAETDTFQRVTFSVEPTDVGQTLYRADISPPEDANAENNRKEFIIDVTDPKNRVVYLEGPPRWEFKFLKRALLTEKNYQLSAFVQGGDGSFINFDETTGQAGGGVPAFTPDSLADYRVIVLGDLARSAFEDEDLANIRDFVDRGGGLLLLCGRRSFGSTGLLTEGPLRELAPGVPEPGSEMREGRFSVDFTAAGRSHPALGELTMEAQLPTVRSFWSPVRAGEFSSALVATADGSPVILVRRFGRGRVAMTLSDTLWNWQLSGGGGGVEKSLYGRFVTQLVYWLAPSRKDLESTTLLQVVTAKGEYELREQVMVGALYDPGEEGGSGDVMCQVKTPDGRNLVSPMQPDTLGEDVGLSKDVAGYRWFFTPEEPGRYEITVVTADGTQEAKTMVLASRPERCLS